MKSCLLVGLAIVSASLTFSPAHAQEFNLASLQERADAGEVKAQDELAFRYLRGMGVTKDYAQALTLYRQAAAQGDALAENQLGFMSQHGWGMPRDYAQASQWYRKSAEQGNASGQNNLGLLYQDGQGVPQDFAQAYAWFRQAADQSLAAAQNNLGNMFHEGQGVPQNYAQAFSWFRKAAEQDVADAQFNLAFMYQHGQGVPQDFAQARSWYQKAADQGVADAKTQLAALDSQQQAERKQQKQTRLNVITSAIENVGQSVQSAANQRAAAAAIAQQNQQQRGAQRESAARQSSQQASQPLLGAQLPQASPPMPISIVFSHSTFWSQGHAHVVSTPSGIDCPLTCSAMFQQGLNVTFQVTAKSDSIVTGLTCYTQTAGGTAPNRTPGNTWTCVFPGFAAGRGGPVIVKVDAVGSNQQAGPPGSR